MVSGAVDAADTAPDGDSGENASTEQQRPEGAAGMPGSGVTIRVRGATSVQASNEPLWWTVCRRMTFQIFSFTKTTISQIHL